MKKLVCILAALLVLSLFAGCSAGKTIFNPLTIENISVPDPKGVTCDSRTVLYNPCKETDEAYSRGVRQTYIIVYGLESSGVYQTTVEGFDSAENAKAAGALVPGSTLEGNCLIIHEDKSVFGAITLEDWITHLIVNGFTVIAND